MGIGILYYRPHYSPRTHGNMNTEFNPYSLKEKTILITGSSSGIGRAIAVYCSKMGARVIVTGRNSNRLDETLNLLEGEGHVAIIADLSSEEGISGLLKDIPKLDGLVLCAGIMEMWPVQYCTKKKFEKIYSTNLFAPIEILRSLIKKKLYNAGCSIVAISSVGGKEITVGNGIYGSGKVALTSFLKYVALETANKNMRVNTVSPGLILTPLQTNGVISEEDLNLEIEKVPMKRWGLPEDIAPGVVYLLSDASKYVTGTDLVIDGGYTI